MYADCTYSGRRRLYVHLKQERKETKMATAEREMKTERLSLRASPRERDVIAEAAEADHKDVSSFMLEAALLTAQRTLADRRLFSLDDDRWNQFVQALDRPVTPLSEKPRLEKLLREPTILDE